MFITALLMAVPIELTEPMKTLEVDSLKEAKFVVPVGWYGFVQASGTGIIRRAGLSVKEGMAALQRLGEPEQESRTPAFDGRRLVRVDNGYIALNFDKYRQKDHTTAERSRRYRLRKSLAMASGVENGSVKPPEIPTLQEAVAMTMTTGILETFSSHVYADWASRSGKDASGVVVAWLPYVTKRWAREGVEWRNGKHKGKKSVEQPAGGNF